MARMRDPWALEDDDDAKLEELPPEELEQRRVTPGGGDEEVGDIDEIMAKAEADEALAAQRLRETVQKPDEAVREQGIEPSLIHISEPTRRYAISYAGFCLKKKQ